MSLRFVSSFAAGAPLAAGTSTGRESAPPGPEPALEAAASLGVPVSVRGAA
jgi:hypothetical protein